MHVRLLRRLPRHFRLPLLRLRPLPDVPSCPAAASAFAAAVSSAFAFAAAVSSASAFAAAISSAFAFAAAASSAAHADGLRPAPCIRCQ